MPEKVAFIDESVGADALALLEIFERTAGVQAIAPHFEFLAIASSVQLILSLTVKIGFGTFVGIDPSIRAFRPPVHSGTVSEAPYILDGLLINSAGKRIKGKCADTGGFTDLVFAATALLGYRFHPRIRDFASKRLHVF